MNLQEMPVLPPQSLQQSIRSTLCFFDLFDYPLTFDELKFYLLSPRHFEDRDLLKGIEEDQSIVHREGFYCLKGSEGHINTRKVRSDIAETYFKKLRRYLPFIKLLPFVEMVAVCNTLAIGCPTSKSDIDLFIISRTNRIFIVRTFTTILFHLLGVRRHGEKVAGRFCLSFFISDDAMDLSGLLKGKDDIYFMYWFRTLRPLYGEKKFRQFSAANLWANEYFGNTEREVKTASNAFWSSGKFYRFFGIVGEFFYGGFLGDILEKYLSKRHLKRHEKKAVHLQGESSVVVNSSMLKYHNVDRRSEYKQKFIEKLSKLE